MDQMQEEIAKMRSTDRSDAQIWDAIVHVTNGVGSDEAKSIRILLYLVIVTGKGMSLWSWIKNCVRFFRRLQVPRKKHLPVATKGRPLFAFLYDPPANTNNLFPLLQAASERGW